MAHQHVGAFDAIFGELGTEFARDLLGIPGFRAHLTGRRIGSLGTLCSDGLVDRPDDGEGQEGDDQP
jgi:hypothetical protein